MHSVCRLSGYNITSKLTKIKGHEGNGMTCPSCGYPDSKEYEGCGYCEIYPGLKGEHYMDKVQQIENNFTYHAPTPGQPERYTQIREQAKALALSILELTPESREQSLALTKLEEAVFWANASIARN
jgi:hypothetical protein